MVWVVAVVGLAIAVGGLAIAIACLPWRVQLRWRKPWNRPLAIRVRIDSPGQWWSFAYDRRSARMQALQRWVWPPRGRTPSILLRQGKHKLRVMRELSHAISVSAWTSQTQFGFDDPSLTGECLGLLAAMPRPVQQSISITFERAGCRSRGQLDLTVKPIALIWRLTLVRARQLGCRSQRLGC